MSDNQSEQARLRTQLFESIMVRSGFEVVPGRYGGDYNNDQIAFRLDESNLQIILGLKTLQEDGSAQLNCFSLGNFMQLTDNWLDIAIYSFSKKTETVSWSH